HFHASGSWSMGAWHAEQGAACARMGDPHRGHRSSFSLLPQLGRGSELSSVWRRKTRMATNAPADATPNTQYHSVATESIFPCWFLDGPRDFLRCTGSPSATKSHRDRSDV